MATKRKLDLSPSDVHVDGVTAPKKKRRRARRARFHIKVSGGGNVEVRHMADKDTVWRLSGFEVSGTDSVGSDSSPTWIQVGKMGHFAGHPTGPFQLDNKTFSEIIANFKRTSNRAIPIDFEHASEADPTSGSIPTDGAPAQGWIKDLEVRGDGLWGQVEWGDKAKEYIKAGQYKYFSPAIRFESKDQVSGKPIGARMTSGALTNTPFLDGMKPVMAKDTPSGQTDTVAVPTQMAYSSHEYMPQLKHVFGLHPLSTPKHVHNSLMGLKKHLDAADGDPNAVVHGVKLSDYVNPLRDMLRMPLHTTIDEILEAVEELLKVAMQELDIDLYEDGEDDIGDGMDGKVDGAVMTASDKVEHSSLVLTLKDRDARISEQEKELAELRAWKTQVETAALNAEVDEAFQTYKDSRNLSDKDKEHLTVLCKAAPESFRALYPKVPVVQKHLLRNVATARPNTTTKEVVVGQGPQVNLTDRMKEISAKSGVDPFAALIQADLEVRKGKK